MTSLLEQNVLNMVVARYGRPADTSIIEGLVFFAVIALLFSIPWLIRGLYNLFTGKGLHMTTYRPHRDDDNVH